MEYELGLELKDGEPFAALETVSDTRPLAQAAFPVLSELLTNLVDMSFTAEGIPPWEPLSEVTVFERLFLGFGEGPILFRTGSLYESFVSDQHPYHVHREELRSEMSTLEVGSSDPRAVPLSEGVLEDNLPARPIFPDHTLIFEEMVDSIDEVTEALYG